MLKGQALYVKSRILAVLKVHFSPSFVYFQVIFQPLSSWKHAKRIKFRFQIKLNPAEELLVLYKYIFLKLDRTEMIHIKENLLTIANIFLPLFLVCYYSQWLAILPSLPSTLPPPPSLYCTVLYCTVLYCTVLYCTVLYCTVLYCTVLYCIQRKIWSWDPLPVLTIYLPYHRK